MQQNVLQQELIQVVGLSENDSGRSPSSPGGPPLPGRRPTTPPNRIAASTSSGLGSLRANNDIPGPQRWVLQTTSLSCYSLSRPRHEQLLLRRAREQRQVAAAVLRLDIKPGPRQQGVKLLRKVYPHRQLGDVFLGAIFKAPVSPDIVDLCRRVINTAFGHEDRCPILWVRKGDDRGTICSPPAACQAFSLSSVVARLLKMTSKEKTAPTSFLMEAVLMRIAAQPQ